MTPIESARVTIADWLSGKYEPADEDASPIDDANELLYALADAGLTVTNSETASAYRAVRYPAATTDTDRTIP